MVTYALVAPLPSFPPCDSSRGVQLSIQHRASIALACSKLRRAPSSSLRTARSATTHRVSSLPASHRIWLAGSRKLVARGRWAQASCWPSPIWPAVSSLDLAASPLSWPTAVMVGACWRTRSWQGHAGGPGHGRGMTADHPASLCHRRFHQVGHGRVMLMCFECF